MILFRTSLRYLLRHPWQIGLCVLGVALGVAVVVSIDLANASARRAFTLSAESISGRATHQIVGGPSGLDEYVYSRLRKELGLRNVAPLVEGYVTAPILDGYTLHLIGIDPLAEGPFRAYLPEASRAFGSASDLARLLVEPATVLMAEATAKRYGITPGMRIDLQIGSLIRPVRVIGLLAPSDNLSARALEQVLIADIATAQELLDQVGRLSRIDLILADGAAGDTQIAAITPLLPPGVQLLRPAVRSSALEQMTRAFEFNLSALSLLALIVGMFLIYNTITFSIVQRRGILGTLRCIGVTRGQVFRLVLVEALIISIIGSLAGLGLGVLLGRGLVQLVTRTINDLYFVVTVRGLDLDPFVLVKGMVLGIGATLIAAAVPAFEATSTPPRSVLRRSSVEEQMRRAVPYATLLGVGLLIVSGLVLLIPANGQACTANGFIETITCTLQSGLVTAFAALFALVIGCALLTPGALILLMLPARIVMGRLFGLLGRMAARDVVAALSRTAIAVAALMVAISVTIGVGVMVSSFRSTVITWLDQALIADIYIAPPSNTANRVDTILDAALATELAALPGVTARTFFRDVQVDTAAGPTTLMVIDTTSPRGRTTLRFRDGGDAAMWSAYDQGALLISEPLAYRLGLGQGDTLKLRTDRGERDFPIAGVYYDYSSDRGIIRLDNAVYRRLWDDTAISSMALYIDSSVSLEAMIDTIRRRVAARAVDGRAPLVAIDSNRSLRAGTLEVFDRTFAITTVLQLLATIVAFIGVLSSLMALQLERSRELGMLRATGLTPRQLWGMVLTQTGLMGFTAGLLALPVGLALALVLIYVINKRSFGWTLNLTLDPWLFFQALIVAIIAALLAAIYPAWRMGRTSPALALREE